jgi:lipoprotein-releasing system permease protein
VLAASFNISSTLFVSVMRRYPDISMLKTMGATDWFVRRLFIGQGLIVGWVGVGAGVLLGFGLCRLVEWAQVSMGLVPPEVYKLDFIRLDIRGIDLLWILLAATLICLVSTLIPAFMGAKLSPVQGLRYE